MEDLLDSHSPTHHPGLKKKLLVDIWVQSVLLAITIVSLLVVIINDGEDYSWSALVFYFGMGMYQLTSSLVQLPYKPRSPLYRAYYIQLFVHLFIFLSAFAGGGLVSMVVLLFLTPLTAIYYFVISIVTYHQTR